MTDLSNLPPHLAPHLAARLPVEAGRWWDAVLTLTVMALARFSEALPHLIQLGGLVVVCLTAVQKLIELGWIRNPRRAKQESSDDAG